MTVRIGNGLPSTLTAERIKAVLGLASSQERQFKEAFETNADPAWRATESVGEFYERLRMLLSTVDGRKAYEDARSGFEKVKGKRSGRLNLFWRLIEDCLKGTAHKTEVVIQEDQHWRTRIAQLVEANSWKCVAEIVWAVAAIKNDAGELDRALDHTLEVHKYLQDVKDGLLNEENGKAPELEEGEEAATLIGRIREIANDLHPNRLDEESLSQIYSAAQKLADIAKARISRVHEITWQKDLIREWEEQHAAALRLARFAAEYLVKLKERIDSGGMDREHVSNILKLIERCCSVESCLAKTSQRAKQAIDDGDEDVDKNRNLTSSLESILAKRDEILTKRDEARAAIDKSLGTSSPGPLGPPQDTTPATTSDEPVEKKPEEAATDTESHEAETDSGEEAVEPEPGESGDDVPDGPPPPTADHGAPAPSVPEPLREVENALGTALARRSFGIAWHLARATPGAIPSADMIELVVCNYVSDERAPAELDLSGLADRLLTDATRLNGDAFDDPRWRDAMVLMTCAALKPALTVGAGGPTAQLLSLLASRLPGDMPALRAIAEKAADVSLKGILLSAPLLRENDTLDMWQDRVNSLKNNAMVWLKRERKAKIKFQPATRVWHQILLNSDRGSRLSLGDVFYQLQQYPDLQDIKKIRETIKYWKDSYAKEIRRIDNRYRSSASTKPIEGSALQSLTDKINYAVSLAENWLRAIDERPDKRPQYHTDQAQQLRNIVTDNQKTAIHEVAEIATPVRRFARLMFERYRSHFLGSKDNLDRQDWSLQELMCGDLLAIPTIEIDRYFRAIEPAARDDLLETLEQDKLDFGGAAIARAKQHDFDGAEAALSFGQRLGQINEYEADRLRTEIDNQRSCAQRELDFRIRELSARLDAAYAVGNLPHETYEQLRERVPQEVVISKKSEFAVVEILNGIDDDINSSNDQRRQILRQSLDTLGSQASDTQRQRVRNAIDKSHFQIAEDLIDRLRQGGDLPEQDVQLDHPFDRFFPKFVDNFHGYCEEGKNGMNLVQEVLRGRDAADFLDIDNLSKGSRDDGVEFLEAWSALRRSSSVSARELTRLMRALGFTGAQVRGNNSEKAVRGDITFMLSADPIADRAVSALPEFGSKANGKYRLLVARGRRSEELIIREAQQRRTAEPNIVLSLGLLDREARRRVARSFSSGGAHPTIFLDDGLVAFLATCGDDRLSAFFDSASAFTFSDPYDPDSPELPPEMFFGRAASRRAIVARDGSEVAHLVYGGRRLGKTTLFADIAREYRDRGQGDPRELVIYINLQGTRIGRDRPTEGVWTLFAAELAKCGVFRATVKRQQEISKGIHRWLNEYSGRSILFLLDEADEFFDAERHPQQKYRVLHEIKQLMEQTSRRFKVVFAGLHNVQRAARDPNTPLAHFGEPIRIGPMLPESDGDEAQKLIRQPFEALGYRFNSIDSVIRIASETNYYPALIQQFCRELLRAVREDTANDRKGPPYNIPSETVDRVFSAKATRDRVQNLFSWTIQLDPRYEFLAYLIAQKSFEEEKLELQSVSIEDICATALDEWPHGFSEDSNFWVFETLLEEMVGLGILRETHQGHYAIRTRNLRTLLGNDDQISRRLSDIKERRLARTFDPAQFRGSLSDSDMDVSVLSAEQESRVVSSGKTVELIFGTRLSGINDVGISLGRAEKEWSDPVTVESIGTAEAQSAFSQALQRRTVGIDIVLVDLRDDWQPSIVNQAVELVAAATGQSRTVRPVFLCGPREAWEHVTGEAFSHPSVQIRETWLGPCGPNFATTWLRQRESAIVHDMEGGNHGPEPLWPVMLKVAAKHRNLPSVEKVIDWLFDTEGYGDYVSDVLISDHAKLIFRLMASWKDPISADDLADLCEAEEYQTSPEEIMELFSWARRLGVIRRADHGYRLDLTYAMGLSRVFGQ